MGSKKEKFSISNVFFITLCALFGIAWCFVVICFLFCNNMSVKSTDVIALCIFTVCAVAGVYGIFNALLCRIKRPFLRYFLILVLFTIAYIGLVIFTPYSPTHDSRDLALILEEMRSGSFSGTYFTSYMNFFATNKLAVYAYLPFVKSLGGTELGVRVANGVFIWVSAVCISAVAYEIKSVNAATVSLLVMFFLCPTLLFSGPYIYPPAIMLSALSMALYMHKEPFIRVFGYLFAGILFTIRPLSLGVLLVYVVCWSFYERGANNKKILYTAAKTAIIIVICFATQWYIGRVMLLTGTHDFDNLDSAMTLWSLDVGTRDEGEQTGVCMHNPSILTDEEASDEILGGFQNLWRLYTEPKEHSDEINAQKEQIKEKILDRIKNDIFKNPESFWQFSIKKFSNYYRDYYKPYFYAVNAHDSDAATLLYKNYDYKYFLYENVFLILFYLTAAAGTISTCIKVYRRQKNSYEAVKVLILFFGVICTSIMSILLTEVGKRLIFDSFVPMCVVISINILRFCKIFRYDRKKSKSAFSLVLSLVATVCGLVGSNRVFESCSVSLFKDCKIEIDEKRNVTIRFSEPVSEDGYVFCNQYDEKIPMTGLSEVSADYIYDEYVARPAYFGFILPDGERLYVAYFEE